MKSSILDDIYQEICLNHGEELMEAQKKNMKDNGELIHLFCSFEETKFSNLFNSKLLVPSKDATKSKFLREEGNKLHLSKKNEEALKKYTEAILNAPHDEQFKGQELSLALANRSAELYQLKHLKLAVEDIDFALEAGYPKNLSYKLHGRKFKCLREFGLDDEADCSLKDFQKSLQSTEFDEVKKKKMIDELVIFKKKVKNKRPSTNNNEQQLPKLTKVNNKFPAFSDSVDIKYEESRGRYGIATRNIKLGEILCVETPTVFSLHQDTENCCYHCFKVPLAPQPSPYTSKIRFCSRNCYNNANESYHGRESAFIDILSTCFLKKKEWMLGLRAVTVHPLEFFMKQSDILSGNPDADYGVNSENEYASNDLKSQYNLVTHHDTWDWSTLAYKAFITVFFLRCLQISGYLGDIKHDFSKLSKEELLIGRYMSYVMETATMNSHEIGIVECPADQSWMSAQTRAVGCAIEPTLVLLNHSCDPTMVRVNSGHSTIAFASRNIKKGEEITDSYSYPYDVTPKDERLTYLENKYKFACKCKACNENWKTANELPRSFNDISMDQLKISQTNIEAIQGKIKTVMTLGATVNQFQKCEDFSSAIEGYTKFDIALNEVLKYPHQFYVMSRRSLSTCLWVLHGNKSRIYER